MVFRERPALRGGLLLLALLSMSVSPGCTSALTTAYLKGTPWNLSDPGADEGEVDESGGAAAESSAAAPQALSPEARAAAREAAIERAIDSLAAIGPVDAETESALIALLQGTDQEDWPAVVDEFVAALAATPHVAAKPAAAIVTLPAATVPAATPAEPRPPVDPPPTAPEPPDAMPTVDVAADAGSTGDAAPADAGSDVVEATSLAAGVADLVSPPQARIREPDGSSAEEESAGATSTAAGSAPPEVSVHNACFATRVQAWGVVDRFAVDRFRPGQEVIVYFELENLSVDRTPAGHTTCIDTGLVLVAADGRRLHDWGFEPIQETCPARRRDYFARYVVRIPGSIPAGACRLEITVTDTLAGRTATTTLPLEIATD